MDERRKEGDPLDDVERAVWCEVEQSLGSDAAFVPRDVMLRFIRGYHYETPRGQKTYEYLRRALDWRHKECIDSLTSAGAPRDLVESGPQFRRAWQSDIYGYLPEGQPVLVHRLGSVDPEGLLSMLSTDQIQAHYLRDMELLAQRKRELAQERGKAIYKHCAVVDLDGFTMQHFAQQLRDPLRDTLQILEYFYPESVSNIFFINTPPPFRYLYRMLSPLIHPLTKDCVRIMGGPNEYWVVLNAAGISRQQLPRMLGGEIPDEQGYFHQHCEAARRRLELQPVNHTSSSSRTKYGRGNPGLSSNSRTDGQFETSRVDNHHFDLVVAAGAKEKLTLLYREADEVVTYTLHVGGETAGMDIGFQVTYQPHGIDATEEVDGWIRHGMGTDKTNSFSREGAGTLVFEFDNSFSYWRPKELSFTVVTTHNEPEAAVDAAQGEAPSSSRRSPQATPMMTKHDEFGGFAEHDVRCGSISSTSGGGGHRDRNLSASGTPARQPQRGLWDEANYESTRKVRSRKKKQGGGLFCCAAPDR